MDLKKLPINMDEVLDALSQSQETELYWFLDTQTGEILTVGSEYLDHDRDDEDEEEWADSDGDDDEREDAAGKAEEPEWIRKEREVARRINEGPDRYEQIEPMGSREGHRLMERFIRTVEDEHLRERLSRAIHGRGAFRYFKDVLADHNMLDRWYAYEREQRLEHARGWLESIGIEPI